MSLIFWQIQQQCADGEKSLAALQLEVIEDEKHAEKNRITAVEIRKMVTEKQAERDRTDVAIAGVISADVAIAGVIPKIIQKVRKSVRTSQT